MVRAITVSEIENLDALLQKYVNHQIERGVTPDTVKQQMKFGIKNSTHEVLIVEDDDEIVQGFLIIDKNSDRIPILFANWNSIVEKQLLEYAFNRLSKEFTHISFESGWPTPWISDDLISFAAELGFVEYDRAYMQLHPINQEVFSAITHWNDFGLVPFDVSMVNEISRLIFKCVDGTADQDIWPSFFISVQRIEDFLHKLLDGSFGKHEDFYSWILQDKDVNIGVCLMASNEETGFIAQIAVDPKYRRRGLGRYLLLHSIHSLVRIHPEISRIELAVTESNPAKLLYQSLGFRTLNSSTTFVWKR